jgi:Pectate lyase superfamily protein
VNNAFLSPIARIVEAFAEQGRVHAGYRVHIYSAGGSTPVTTYTDASLSVANANPIVLAAGGKLPGSVWGPAGMILKMAITDPGANAVPGGTVDNLRLIDDVLSALHPKTPAEVAAKVFPVNYRYAPGNVLRYGADPSGAANSFAAVKECLKAAVTGNNESGVGDHGRVYFPRGTYLIDGNGLFNQSGDFQRGFIIEGDGLASSVLKLRTGGASRWFYDNSAPSTQQYIFVTVRDLCFTSDHPPDGNGFRFQQDQGWRFFRCWLYNLNVAIDSEGGRTGNNGSEHKFYSCKFTHIREAVHLFNNLQCLNIEYHGCDVESIFGDVFRIGPGGGGALRVFGGSYIMDDGGSPHYLLNIAGSGIGNNNNTYTINGIQTELHSTNNRLVYHGSGGGGAHIVFNECNITATQGARQQVSVTTARVTFNRCVLRMNQGDTYQVGGPQAGGGDQYGEPGSIHFVECDVPENLSALCSVPPDGGDGLAWGMISARGCYCNGYAGTDARTNRYAMDFDLNWYNGGRAGNFSGLKTISVKPQNRSWPAAGSAYDWVVTLPRNALIAAIQIFRPANDGPDQPYELHVGNGDKSRIYGTDGGGIRARAARSISVQFSLADMISAGDSHPNNQVRVWADPSTSYLAALGGYFIVQYY